MRIDYVVSYVDSRDREWRRLYEKYRGENRQSQAENRRRFGENDLFRFQFRGIEKFMPWIDRVFLVVQSRRQVPRWLDADAVRIVTHEEFIPGEFLPTFNSCTIECFMHMIPGLSPLFVYGNDDMYVMGEIGADVFFSGYMPLNTIVKHTSAGATEYERMMLNTTKFVMDGAGLRYDGTFYYSPRHVQNAFSKGIFRKIFDENEAAIRGSVSRFREVKNFSQYFFTDYYMVRTGCVYNSPIDGMSSLFDLEKDFAAAAAALEGRRGMTPLVCLNNSNPDTDMALYRAFREKFPGKSRFEK